MTAPEMINAGELVLKRWDPGWAADLAVAVRESLPELRPFLPWATDDYSVESAAVFLALTAKQWDEDTDFGYAIFTATGDLIGSIGLISRLGPGTMEIGYWLRTAYTGRGHTTAAVSVLTRVALTLPGITRVTIRHDAANVASAAVAAKAGFAEVGREDAEPAAPGETGTNVIRDYRP